MGILETYSRKLDPQSVVLPMIEFHELMLAMFGALYGLLAAYVLSRFGIPTQDIVEDPYLWYDCVKLYTVPSKEIERFLWQLHGVIAYPNIYFGHYSRIRSLAEQFANVEKFEDTVGQYLREILKPEKRPPPSWCVYARIVAGILGPPVFFVLYYFWLPSWNYQFRTMVYCTNCEVKSLVELLGVFLVSAAPLGGYVGAVAQLERTVTPHDSRYPPRYSHIAKWYGSSLALWSIVWAIVLWYEVLPNAWVYESVLIVMIAVVGFLILRLFLHYVVYFSGPPKHSDP